MFSGETKRKYVYTENVARKAFIDKSVQKLVNNSKITNDAVKHCINEGQDPKICEQLRD